MYLLFILCTTWFLFNVGCANRGNITLSQKCANFCYFLILNHLPFINNQYIVTVDYANNMCSTLYHTNCGQKIFHCTWVFRCPTLSFLYSFLFSFFCVAEVRECQVSLYRLEGLYSLNVPVINSLSLAEVNLCWSTVFEWMNLLTKTR